MKEDDLIEIKWVGVDRFTKYGLGTKGAILLMPRRSGKSFIAQGLAKAGATVPKRVAKLKEESK